MPLLEAMACGCPVITSDRTACVEVVGDSAITVDPWSVDDIRDAIEEVLHDSKLRQSLVAKEKDRTDEFSWHKSALKHLEVFQGVTEK
jgi:glycosyltransferase involved in cell wall biosynthesis